MDLAFYLPLLALVALQDLAKMQSCLHPGGVWKASIVYVT
jgi:hypothetical protein